MSLHDKVSAWGAFLAAVAAFGSLWLATCEYKETQRSNEAIREMELAKNIEAVLLENASRVEVKKNINALRLLWTYEQQEQVSPEIAKVYSDAFCDALKLEAFQMQWQKVSSHYNSQFVTYMDEIFDSCGVDRKGD